MISTTEEVKKPEEVKTWDIPEGKLKIVTYPTESLLTPSVPITEFDDSLKELVKDMQEFMATLPGIPVGLAAPQIGVNKRLFITKDEVYINPVIKLSASQNHLAEGCYSLPPKRFFTWRAQSVWVTYQDVEGKEHQAKYNGKQAQVIQHEFDHLEGKVCATDEQITAPSAN